MERNHLLKSLERFRRSAFFSHDEHKYYEQIVAFIHAHPGCFQRENPGHITGSIWLVNHDLSQVLLTHHKKLGMWLQLGGHADGDPHIPSVAMKEAQEESGIEGLIFLEEGIFDIDIHLIPNACIAHYDIRYLIQAPKDAPYAVSAESHDLAWVPLEKLESYTTAPSITRMAQKLKR